MFDNIELSDVAQKVELGEYEERKSVGKILQRKSKKFIKISII